MSSRRRTQLFGVLVAVCVVAAALALAAAIGSDGTGPTRSAAKRVLVDARDEHRPSLVFRDLRDAASNGKVAVAGLDYPARRTLVPLRCDRVHFSARNGLCVVRGSGFGASYRALVFSADFHVRFGLELAGIPSRARVSPDGRRGSVTMFVQGHSYADAGSFSTQTTLIDLQHGFKIGDLEQFAVTRAGRRVTAGDVNFWGVTFARDSDRFYATLATGGRTYLVEGSVRDRTARTIHDNVECPSLSPDGTRIGYKQRVPGRDTWRLTVLDLRTMHETPLAETRGIDDQVEWLDDDRLLYGIDREIWMVSADGSGEARRYAAGGDSPAVVRWSGATPARGLPTGT